MNAFRQSMGWLHGWAGLLAGWLLYFMFVTGSLGYLNAEISAWMRPEVPHAPASAGKSREYLAKASSVLMREHGAAQSWYIYLPGGHRTADFAIGWRDWPTDGSGAGPFTRQPLDSTSGAPLDVAPRETGGGMALYLMHYQLRYLPGDFALRITGAVAMGMLVALLTGVVIHKKIFKEFFVFRPGRGARSWMDGHTLLGVANLPFLLMITWSGLVVSAFTYLPMTLHMAYPDDDGREQFAAHAYGGADPGAGQMASSARAAPLENILTSAERQWGQDSVRLIRVEAPNRVGSVVMLSDREQEIGAIRHLKFDGITGELMNPPQAPVVAARFQQALVSLHEGRFAGSVLRALYVFAGLSGTAMIAFGLLLWSSKRKSKLKEGDSLPPSIAAVDTINLGTVIGLPIAVAAYFWANRLIPVGMEGRGEWEVHTMFITWGLTYIFAIWRPLDRAWLELCCLAAFAYGSIPILNALTTDRHLLNSIPQGDWVMAGFDFSAFGAGLFFLFLVRTIRRKQRRQVVQSTRQAGQQPASIATEAV